MFRSYRLLQVGRSTRQQANGRLDWQQIVENFALFCSSLCIELANFGVDII